MNLESILIKGANLIAIVATVLAMLGAWTGIHGWIDGFKGLVSGRILTEDGAPTKGAKLKFLSFGEFQMQPDENGFFSAALQRGNYELEIEAPGYQSVKISTRALFGGSTDPLGDIRLLVEPKTINVKLVDRTKNPFSDVSFALFDPKSRTQYQAVSDANGESKIEKVRFGNYRLVIGAYTSTANAFLWVRSHEEYSGELNLKAAQNSYELVLPRVVYSEGPEGGSRSAIAFKPGGGKYFAQAIDLPSGTSFHGLGIGLGLAKDGVPSAIQIRADEKGIPGSVIAEGAPLIPNAAVSTGTEGSYAPVYRESDPAKTVTAGTYWIVAFYDQVPATINVLGNKHQPKSKKALLVSADGTTWAAHSFGDLHMVDLFLVE